MAKGVDGGGREIGGTWQECGPVFILRTRRGMDDDQQRRVERVASQTKPKSRVGIYTTSTFPTRAPSTFLRTTTATLSLPLYFATSLAKSSSMAPKPASTAGKAPASTASKAPAKSTEGAKAAKKTSKAAAPADGEKKKRKKIRKETYSSYIYKGE